MWNWAITAQHSETLTGKVLEASYELHHCHQADIKHCDEYTLVMQTDCSAVVELKGQDTLNSAHSNYCQLSCSAVMHSPEIIEYNSAQRCDYVRFVRPEPGGGSKDGDWFCHDMMLVDLVKFYQLTLPNEIRRVVLWTDGSPSQYKCRQTFAFEATIIRRMFPNLEVNECRSK